MQEVECRDSRKKVTKIEITSDVRTYVLDLIFDENRFFADIDFLSRIYNLEEMPSTDSRFKNAQGDIWQHTENNDDWDYDWVRRDYRFGLQTDDKALMKFVCELFHPMVRKRIDDWEILLRDINNILKHNNIEIIQSVPKIGLGTYSVKEIEISPIIDMYSDKLIEYFDSDYMEKQIKSMVDNMEGRPHIAVGKAKELVESCAKYILDELGMDYKQDIEFGPLTTKCFDALGLNAKSQSKEMEIGQISAKILGSQATIIQNMATLRNHFGDGHGKGKQYKMFPPRYARLAVGSATTLVRFLWETHTDKKAGF